MFIVFPDFHPMSTFVRWISQASRASFVPPRRDPGRQSPSPPPRRFGWVVWKCLEHEWFMKDWKCFFLISTELCFIYIYIYIHIYIYIYGTSVYAIYVYGALVYECLWNIMEPLGISFSPTLEHQWNFGLWTMKVWNIGVPRLVVWNIRNETLSPQWNFGLWNHWEFHKIPSDEVRCRGLG